MNYPPLVCNIIQDKQEFSSSELSLDKYNETFGKLSMQKQLTAGSWKGSFVFQIGLILNQNAQELKNELMDSKLMTTKSLDLEEFLNSDENIDETIENEVQIEDLENNDLISKDKDNDEMIQEQKENELSQENVEEDISSISSGDLKEEDDDISIPMLEIIEE